MTVLGLGNDKKNATKKKSSKKTESNDDAQADAKALQEQFDMKPGDDCPFC